MAAAPAASAKREASLEESRLLSMPAVAIEVARFCSFMISQFLPVIVLAALFQSGFFSPNRLAVKHKKGYLASFVISDCARSGCNCLSLAEATKYWRDPGLPRCRYCS